MTESSSEDHGEHSADQPAPAHNRGRRAPAPGERRRDPERTRERIVAAATAEFAAKGFAGARVTAIAARAGVNQQLISYYFGGKEGLYRAVAERGRRVRTPGDGAGDGATGPGGTGLGGTVSSYVPASPDQRALARLLAWEGLAAGAEDASGADDPDAQERAASMRAAVADLRRRQAAGELPDGLDADCVLLALVAAALAPATLPQLARAITGEDPASAAFTGRYAEQLARLVAHLAQPAGG